ncbi:5891_t:CDS:2, partial [Funneliformis geosporum]
MPDDFYTGRSFAGVGSEASNCFYEANGSFHFELATQDYTTDPPTQINAQIIQEINKNLFFYKVKQSVPSNKTLKKLLTAAMVVVTVTGAFMLAGAIGAGGAGLVDGSALNAVQGNLNTLNQTNQLLSGAKSLLPDENGNISYSF